MRQYGGPVAGIDEAGRGPLAGPVVAAAVILPPSGAPASLDDSKRLTPELREDLYEEIIACAWVGVGVAGVNRIDTHNILQATLWAMGVALSHLSVTPAAAIVDGNVAPFLPCPSKTLVQGDALSVSVAAASVVAKVTRDRMMVALAREFPGYGWERNKGYGTPEHHQALKRLGITAHHRRSFQPVREAYSGSRALLQALNRPG